jgi:hypothetical protein
MRATPVILISQRLAIPLKGEDMAAITAAESTRQFVVGQPEPDNLAEKLCEIEEISHIDYAGSGTLELTGEQEPWNWVAFDHSPKPGATIPEFQALIVRIGDVIVAYVEACKAEADPAVIAQHLEGFVAEGPSMTGIKALLDFPTRQQEAPDGKPS